ncbi:MAG: ribonuclease H-like domain-containing protein [Clostridia bacterium]|nr:ribonuclease H-like domain-containing protein [Clostridia bacterium]
MNLREKLRAVGGSSGAGRDRAPAQENRDCKHLAVFRPLAEFPGALAVRRETVAKMSQAELPERFDPRRILYLDTETTGLGGSGTVAFLVGLGYLTERGFEVHQFLMRDYDEEPYLLRHVAAGLDRFDMICTFNGRTFDVPLLESRFLMNRMGRECLEKPHLDLLHVARRLWKLRLGRCNLGRLEEVILGKPRVDDLPGSEVPQRYFDYLKTRQEFMLQDILDHNAQDIATLCVLLTHMAEMYDHPEGIAASEDVYSLGRALEKFDHPEEARRCYRLATRGKMGAEASAALAHSYRRAGDRAEAAEIWREMIRTHRGGVGPYIELAKYQEHGQRDPGAALETTEKALMLLSEARLTSDDTVQGAQNELQYRRQRLKRKLAKADPREAPLEKEEEMD